MHSELYQLVFEERADLLYISVSAPLVTLEIAIRYINEMVAFLRNTEYTSVLFERHTPTVHTHTEYAIIGSVIFNIVPRNINFAIVDHSPSLPIIKRFFETQYGADSHVKAFDTLEEAKEWLRMRKNSSADTQTSDLA